jgi:hypothetical protein
MGQYTFVTSSYKSQNTVFRKKSLKIEFMALLVIGAIVTMVNCTILKEA